MPQPITSGDYALSQAPDARGPEALLTIPSLLPGIASCVRAGPPSPLDPSELKDIIKPSSEENRALGVHGLKSPQPVIVQQWLDRGVRACFRVGLGGPSAWRRVRAYPRLEQFRLAHDLGLLCATSQGEPWAVEAALCNNARRDVMTAVIALARTSLLLHLLDQSVPSAYASRASDAIRACVELGYVRLAESLVGPARDMHPQLIAAALEAAAEAIRQHPGTAVRALAVWRVVATPRPTLALAYLAGGCELAAETSVFADLMSQLPLSREEIEQESARLRTHSPRAADCIDSWLQAQALSASLYAEESGMNLP